MFLPGGLIQKKASREETEDTKRSVKLKEPNGLESIANGDELSVKQTPKLIQRAKENEGKLLGDRLTVRKLKLPLQIRWRMESVLRKLVLQGIRQSSVNISSKSETFDCCHWDLKNDGVCQC
jgi:hypothetical protein